MRRTWILVDYHNTPGVAGATVRGYRKHGEPLALIERGLIELRNRYDVPGLVNLRFYGGWKDTNARNTPDYDALSAQVRKRYPTRVGGARVVGEMALSPIVAPEVEFFGTLRTTPGFPAFKVTPPRCPEHLADCPLRVTRALQRGRCQYARLCTVPVDCVSRVEQKMVDTMIVADAVELCFREQHAALVVVSNDDDLLPALVSSTGRKVDAYLLRLRRKKSSGYEDLLQSLNVTVVDI